VSLGAASGAPTGTTAFGQFRQATNAHVDSSTEAMDLARAAIDRSQLRLNPGGG
jgi:hypothetical protein